MMQLEQLMEKRTKHIEDIGRIDEQILEAILPEVREELVRRGTVWLTGVVQLAESLPAPKQVVSRAFERLIIDGVAERGFDGMNDTYIFRPPIGVPPWQGDPFPMPPGK